MPDAASLPTALRKTRWRKPPPSRRVEVTGQCATLTSAGSTPVACSARAICRGEGAPGSHERSSARHPTRTRCRRNSRRCGSRHPMRARTSARAEGKARAARRVPIADRCSPIPGFRAQERSASFFSARITCTRAGSVRSTEISTRRSWSRCLADFARASCTRRDCVKARPHDRYRPTRRYGIEAQLAERPVVNRSVLVRIQPIPPQ